MRPHLSLVPPLDLTDDAGELASWPARREPGVQGNERRRRLTRVETVRLESHPELLFVRLHTRDGLVGLGEAYGDPEQIEHHLHHDVAPALLRTEAARFDAVALEISRQATVGGRAAVRRGASAVDVALWDLAGKTAGLPVRDLLGGATRERIRIYNSLPTVWDASTPRAAVRLFELAEDLHERQITAMKVEPFDLPGVGDGQDISARDIRRALAPLERIKSEFGPGMDVLLEFHSRWELRPAKRIARAVEELDPFWLEEPIRADDLSAIAAYARFSRVPMTLREPLRSRYAIKDLLDRRIAGIVMFSLGWSGGLSEAVRVASLANDYHLPLTLYGRTGPVLLSAATQLSVSAPNALIQETVRDYYTDWYHDLVTELPDTSAGTIAPPPGPGLGTELLPDLLRRPGTTVRVTA